MIDLENTIDSDDEPDGSEGGYTRKGNYIVPDAMREIVCLRREVEEQRSLISELRRDSDMRYNRMTYEAEQHAQLRVQYDDLRRERDELRRENEKWGALCDIEYTSGAKFGWNCAVADDDERFERVCRDRNRGALQELKRLKPKGEWLPAPDSKPPELADAQMVEFAFKCSITDRLKEGAGLKERADRVPWHVVGVYRPLYSDSGLPLCSPEGLEEWARFVASDRSGKVYQYEHRPWQTGVWCFNGVLRDAPESHRRPGPWRETLMEVTRR